MAGIDGIKNKINPTKEGFGPFDVNVFDLPEEEKNKIGALPTSLDEALKELEKDYEFLLPNGVFDKYFIDNWINIKRGDIARIRNVPCPIEFELYYDL